MYKKRPFALFAGFIAIALVSLACGISLPADIPSADAIATNVANTVAALAQTAIGGVTPDPHELPTLSVTEAPPVVAPAAPLSVAWIGPDRNAYYWNETLSGPTMLTSSGDADGAYVSPDGSLVAVTRSADWTSYQLLLMNFDGTNQRTVMDAAGFASLPRPAGSVASLPYQVTWLPGGHVLVMNTRISFEGPGLAIGEYLYMIDADTNTLNPLFIGGSAWNYTLSPDGSKIAISRAEGIDTYNLDGSLLAETVLVYPFINTASEYAWVAEPVWSSDSTTLLAVVPPTEPWVDAPEDSTLWRVSADGMSGELVFSTTMVYFPSGFSAISPNLAKIAFLARYGAPADNLYTVKVSNIDGTALADYAVGRYNGAPAWSPDNNKFFFYDRESSAYLGQVGVSPIAMPELGNVRQFQWVDENRLVVSSGPEGGWKLLLVTVGGPTGVIYTTPLTSDFSLGFSTNR